MTYLESLRSALHDVLAADPRVIVLGEDILDPYGGAFKVTKGLSTAFPERVLTTPISEGAITGIVAGLSLRGMLPVLEIMFGDFLTLCADQIVNHIAKFHGMYNGQVQTPLVIRTPMGGGRGYGATHSQSLEKLFLGVPGIKVVAPSHAHDPGQLLRHAILADRAPVLFIEHKLLYAAPLLNGGDGLSLRYINEGDGYPTALVTNFTEGEPDVTVIAYGGASRILLPVVLALKREEIKVLTALPSSLKPLPIETLVSAAKQSGRVVIAEEGSAGFNWGSEVAAVLYHRLFGRLLCPILRLASAETVIPCAKDKEDRLLINATAVEDAIMEVLA